MFRATMCPSSEADDSTNANLISLLFTEDNSLPCRNFHEKQHYVLISCVGVHPHRKINTDCTFKIYIYIYIYIYTPLRKFGFPTSLVFTKLTLVGDMGDILQRISPKSVKKCGNLVYKCI